MKRVAVYGASGFGREVMPLVRHQLSIAADTAHLVFIDDSANAQTVNGHSILPYARWLALEAIERWVCIAIADSRIRQKLAEQCAADSVKFFEARASNVFESDGLIIGEGGVFSPFVTLNANSTIGKHFHANLYSYVGHDCTIGDFVTFAPGVKCNGNVVIEDHAYIGTGAIIKQGTPDKPLVIGRGAVVGMGAVVTKDVAAGTTVVGNPARPLVR